MAITADNYQQYLANYTPSANVGSAGKIAPTRSPGNWATHLLPVVGSILGGLAGGIPGAAIGGAGAKALENKFEKQSLGNGVVGQGLLGGASEGIGGLVAPVIGKAVGGAGSFISNLLGREGTEAATQGAADVAANGAAEIAPTSAAEAVPGSSSSWLDKILGRNPAPVTPAVSEGTGAVEVGQGGKIVSLGGKTVPEATTQVGANPGATLATAETPYKDAVNNYLESKGLATHDNPLYNKGAEFTASPRNLDQAFRGSLKAPDMAGASNTLLDTLGKGGSVADQFNELPNIHQTVTNDLKGVLGANTDKVAAKNLTDELGKIPESEFGIKPMEGLSSADQFAQAQAAAQPGSVHGQVEQALGKASDIIGRYTDADGNISATGLLNINQEVGDLIKPAQWNALRGIGDAAVTPVDQANFKIWQTTRQALEKVSPEASDILKVQSLTGHELPKALQSGIADTGTARVGIRGTMRGGIPGSAELFQHAQSGLGRALQGLGGAAPQLAETAKVVVPQILGHDVGSAVDKEQTQAANEAAAANAPKLNAPGTDVAATLGTTNETNQLGITSDQIKQAELADLETTGGKNYSELSKLGTIVNAFDKSQTLSPAGQGDVSNYENTLQALQGVSDTFASGASKDQVATAIATTVPYLTKATGLAPSDLKKLLPAPTDNQQIVNQKLSDIKQLIDSKANDTIQNQLSKNAPDTSSLVGSLVGV